MYVSMILDERWAWHRIGTVLTKRGCRLLSELHLEEGSGIGSGRQLKLPEH